MSIWSVTPGGRTARQGWVLAIVWMSFAVKQERQQRNFSAPIQTR